MHISDWVYLITAMLVVFGTLGMMREWQRSDWDFETVRSEEWKSGLVGFFLLAMLWLSWKLLTLGLGLWWIAPLLVAIVVLGAYFFLLWITYDD